MKDFIVVLVHFFNRNKISDFGYERATNLISLYIFLLIGIAIALGLKIIKFYSKPIFNSWTNGFGKMIFLGVLLTFLFLFNFLFKQRIIILYEKSLENLIILNKKYNRMIWLILGFLPILFVAFVLSIRYLIV